MQSFFITGGKKLRGEIIVNTSKNAAVALLAASCMNRGVTTLKNVPQIEEVERWCEILVSIGMGVERSGRTVKLTPPRRFDVGKIDVDASEKTRSVILLIGALAAQQKSFALPQAGGCHLGKRTVSPHIDALSAFGISVKTRACDFFVTRRGNLSSPGRFALSESGDTVTENALFAAAQSPGVSEIRFASANYMVQDVCFFLQKCGVKIEGVGTTTLKVHGKKVIKKNVTYEIAEDPIEAMFFIALAVATRSTLSIMRCPYDFLELELTKLTGMGLNVTQSKMYKARNKKTSLVDLTIKPSRLRAPEDKIEERPFPGINMDNLPFFAVIATQAHGTTLIHDWAYEDRAAYFTELNKLGARVELLDQHRAEVTGPSVLTGAKMSCPPALRPGAVLLVAMLGAHGASELHDVYMINRGYENLAVRLQGIGAAIEVREEE